MSLLGTRKVLTLEAARVVIDAGEAFAVENRWKVVIAVVDAGGHPIALVRLDGAQWSSVDTAIEKARAAIAWKRPSRLLEESIAGGRTALLSIAQGMAMLQGGLPLEADGEPIGAVGVSGVKASDDERVALAGVEAFRTALAAGNP